MLLRPSTLSTAAAVFAVALFNITPACASLHLFKDQVLPTDLIIYRKSGMYSLVDTPATRRNNADAYIKLDLTFERIEAEYPNTDTSVQVTLFKEDNYDKLGYQPPSGPRIYCCTKNLKSKGICKDPNTLIIGEDAGGTTEVLTYIFGHKAGSATRISALQSMSIKEKGVYYLLFSSCNRDTGSVLINGHTTWVNPYGMLPGELYGFLPFYGRMSLAYLFASFVWAGMCSRHWRDLMLLHNFLTGALLLGMLEVLCRYLDFHTLNETGIRSGGTELFALLFTALKQAMARALVLAVSMGYGVVRPTLGDLRVNVLALAAAFVFFSLLQSMLEHINHSSPTNSTALALGQYVMMMPKAVLDVVFCFWTFRSLQSTLHQVAMREQYNKLALYARFQKLLLLTVVMSVSWALYYVYAVDSNTIEMKWETRWAFEGFWDLMYFFVLAVMMVMWRPNSANERIAYHQVEQYDDEEYGEELEDPTSFVKPTKAIAVGHENVARHSNTSSITPLSAKHD